MPRTLREDATPRLAAYDAAAYRARELFIRKNTEYGDAVADNGVAGILFEWAGISGRLKVLRNSLLRLHFQEFKSSDPALLKAHSQLGEVKKQLYDKLLDAANYALIGLTLMDEGNTVGRD